MRLLNAETRELESFDPNDIPTYAIISHTWGPTEEEISFQDLSGQRAWDPTAGPPHDSPKAVGWKKLAGACRVALNDGFRYIWIDTCCIDKSSSAELSEAINSMFRWYAKSRICYAYLADVHAGIDPQSEQTMQAFRESRWFTRGWTLQELLAPALVIFFDSQWAGIGTKYELQSTITLITGIHKGYVRGPFPTSPVREWQREWQPQRLLATVSVAERMSWAARRRTTRIEDQAYCLLGIFDIAIPMLYGEGDRAFGRLQEAIMEVTDDPTLLAWNYQMGWPEHSSDDWENIACPILAPSPAAFKYCGRLERYPPPARKSDLDLQGVTFSMTQQGLKLKASLLMDKRHKHLGYLLLPCGLMDKDRDRPETLTHSMAVPVITEPLAGDDVDVKVCRRPVWSRPVFVTARFISRLSHSGTEAKRRKIIIGRASKIFIGWQAISRLPFNLVSLAPTDGILHVYPPCPILFRRVRNLDLSMLGGKTDPSFREGPRDSDELVMGDPGAGRRLVHARILGLELLIHIQFSIATIPLPTFNLKLNTREWPCTPPHISVYRLHQGPCPVDLLSLYEFNATEGAKLSPIVTSHVSPSGTERLYICDGTDGKLVRFSLDIDYEHEHRGTSAMFFHSFYPGLYQLRGVIKVSHDAEEHNTKVQDVDKQGKEEQDKKGQGAGDQESSEKGDFDNTDVESTADTPTQA